ncbi:MAG: SDR family oxidoreductase, partial [Candidatus Hydrogenedentes bacterium]|nr:SDR family oxidoreductase [Candidatus Hydrogenedentota bacterium]
KRMLEYTERAAPLRRTITAEEVGKSAVYLVSDLSSGVTAEVLHVDAGYNAMGMTGEE